MSAWIRLLASVAKGAFRCPYKAMNFNPRKTYKPGQKGVAEKRDLRLRRLDQGLLPGCLITRLGGGALDGGGFNAPRARHPDAKQMGDDAGQKMLYGTMGDEPMRRTASYLSPVPSHD